MSNGKNLAKVKDMVEGKFGGYKPQVGFGDQEGTPIRKVGEEWEDSEGYKWTQREGYAVKSGASPNVGIFHQQCEDCDKNCSLSKMHQDSYIRFKKCFYCQMNFEIHLKSFRGKWEAWVRLQELNNMDVIEYDMVQALEEDNKMDTKIKKWDESVANALANYETEQHMDFNKKLTR